MQVHNKKGIIFPFFFLYFYNFQMLEVMSDLETKGGGRVGWDVSVPLGAPIPVKGILDWRGDPRGQWWCSCLPGQTAGDILLQGSSSSPPPPIPFPPLVAVARPQRAAGPGRPHSPPPPSAASASGCAHLLPGGQSPLPPLAPCPVPVPRGLFWGPVHHSQGRRLVHLSVSWVTKQRSFFKKKVYIGGLLLYNVVLDSAMQ